MSRMKTEMEEEELMCFGCESTIRYSPDEPPFELVDSTGLRYNLCGLCSEHVERTNDLTFSDELDLSDVEIIEEAKMEANKYVEKGRKDNFAKMTTGGFSNHKSVVTDKIVNIDLESQGFFRETGVIDCPDCADTHLCLESPEPFQFQKFKLHTCPDCGFAFQKKYFLLSHKRDPRKRECKYCETIHFCKKEQSQHPMKCQVCDLTFELQSFLKHSHKPLKLKPGIVRKDSKGVTTATNENSVKTMKLEPNQPKEITFKSFQPVLLNGIQVFKPTLTKGNESEMKADLNSQYLLNYEQHSDNYTHTDETPFACDKCGESFLTTHHHCKVLQRSYTRNVSKVNLSVPDVIYSAKEPEKPDSTQYRCSICLKYLQGPKSLLEEHRKKHFTSNTDLCDLEPEEPLPTNYRCSICLQYSLNRKALVEHRKEHFASNVEFVKKLRGTNVRDRFTSLQCTICVKFCGTRESLKNHKIIEHFNSSKLARKNRSTPKQIYNIQIQNEQEYIVEIE